MIRRTSLRLLLVFFAALWLPLQAAAGLAMPILMQGGNVGEPAAASGHCHEMDMAQADDQPIQSDKDCQDNCELCHLASVGFLLPALAPSTLATTWRELAPPPLPAFSSRTTEPLQRPPRSI